MENTQAVYFDGDQPEWFFSVGDQSHGPVKAEEIYQMLIGKRLGWGDFIYREKEGRWIKILEHPTFQGLGPTATPPVSSEVKWFLFQRETQTGPYLTAELIRLVNTQQVLEGAFVWQESFEGWKPISEVEPFGSEFKTTPMGSTPKEKRKTPRKPLLAQVVATNLSRLISGICRDISVGGMQILTGELPGPAGTQIRLNVTPPLESGLGPFVAEGTVVRILEDQRGFSFRFSKISDTARTAIETYIERDLK